MWIMNVHNLYLYHRINDVFKILKFRTPISLFSLFDLSCRTGKETYALTPKPSESYIYRASTIWNIARQKLAVSEFTTTVSHIKSSIKNIILNTQKLGESTDWNNLLNNLSQAHKNTAITWKNFSGTVSVHILFIYIIYMYILYTNNHLNMTADQSYNPSRHIQWNDIPRQNTPQETPLGQQIPNLSFVAIIENIILRFSSKWWVQDQA